MERIGGIVERGIVKAVLGNQYILESIDRTGIETLPLEAINDETFSSGEKVYFFCFSDGTGKIICGF